MLPTEPMSKMLKNKLAQFSAWTWTWFAISCATPLVVLGCIASWPSVTSTPPPSTATHSNPPLPKANETSVLYWRAKSYRHARTNSF